MAPAQADDFLQALRPAGSRRRRPLPDRPRGRRSTALTDAVGFRYAYDAAIDQYAHPAAITVLTPEGHVSRYLFGIEFAPRDLQAGAGRSRRTARSARVVDQVLLFCYHYDPETGKYGFAIMNVVRLAGVLTVLALGAFISVTLRRERRQDSAVRTTATGTR